MNSQPGPGTSREFSNSNENVTRNNTHSGAKRTCPVTVEQQSGRELKKTKTVPELRYRCSFCMERFPSLTSVRDHTRACHREENERRKESKIYIRLRDPPEKKIESHQKILFKCKCYFVSSCYDRMIEHCQYHVIKLEYPGAMYSFTYSTEKCVINDVEYDVDYDTFIELRNESISKHVFVNCEYELLKQDKWPGIFDNCSVADTDRINCASIHYFTRIIQMTSRKKPSSASFMVFQCEKCMKHIDPHRLVAHVQENSCNKNLPDFPCHVCNIPFLSENSMYLHYKMHEAITGNLKFRTVIFNSPKNDLWNALLLQAAGLNMRNTSKYLQEKLLRGVTKAQIEVISMNRNPQINNTQRAELCMKMVPSCSKTAYKQIAFTDPMKTYLQRNDARSMIIQGTKTNPQNITVLSENSNKMIAKRGEDKVFTVYNCQCDLSFHNLEYLLKHLENCGSECISPKICSSCALVFDDQQYEWHHRIHSQGFTKLNIKRIAVCDELKVVSNTLNEKKKHEIDNEMSRKIISKLVESIQSIFSNWLTSKNLQEKRKELLPNGTSTNSVGLNEGMDNLNKICETKSMSDVSRSVVKSQGIITTTSGTITVHEVNEELDEIEHLKKSILLRDRRKSQRMKKRQKLKLLENRIVNATLHKLLKTLVGISKKNLCYDIVSKPKKSKKQSTFENTKEAVKGTPRGCSKIINDEDLCESPKENEENDKNYEKNNKECDQIQKASDIRIIKEEIIVNEILIDKNLESQESTEKGKSGKEMVNVNKTYTEDELLDDPTSPIYFDAEESTLTDDEDPILLYEDDAIDIE